jgi:hypothetical protein
LKVLRVDLQLDALLLGRADANLLGAPFERKPITPFTDRDRALKRPLPLVDKNQFQLARLRGRQPSQKVTPRLQVKFRHIRPDHRQAVKKSRQGHVGVRLLRGFLRDPREIVAAERREVLPKRVLGQKVFRIRPLILATTREILHRGTAPT